MTKINFKLNLLSLAVTSILLSACGGSDNKTLNDDVKTDDKVDLPINIIQLDAPSPSTAKLKKASNEEETLSRIRNALLYSSNQNYHGRNEDSTTTTTTTETSVDTATPIALPQESNDGNITESNTNANQSIVDDQGSAAGQGGESSKGNFSGTNVIEQGVDEADIVKYDGTTLFVAVNEHPIYSHFDDVIEPGFNEELTFTATSEDPETFTATAVEDVFTDMDTDNLITATETDIETATATNIETETETTTDTVVTVTNTEQDIETDTEIEFTITDTTTNGSGSSEPAFFPDIINEGKSYIRVMQADSNGTMQEQATIALNDDQQQIDALYLSHEKLTVFSTPEHNSWEWSSWGRDASFWQNGSISLSSYDVATPSAPSELNKVLIDGYLIQSRRIGDKIYVISQFSPTSPELQWIKGEDDIAYANNASIVENLSQEQLLPTITINDNQSQTLVKPEDCYIPEDNQENSSNNNILAVTVFDVNDISSFESSCINGYNSGFYMSQNAIYLTSQSWDNSVQNNNTTIHKLDLVDSGVEYSATGIVPGDLGWRAAAFRLNEYNDLLRVITSTREDDKDDRLDHHLYVLQENQGSLDAIAQLPNDAQPEELGKPHEDIYAARFYNDRAYLVTFESIDPLYVLDLSEPASPIIAGQLEIPGFSTYLHPLGDNYLLGIGQNAPDPSLQTLMENGESNTIKLGLFDVSDMSSPKEISTQLVGKNGTWSPALNEHHAISILKDSDSQYRLAFPASVYEKDARYTKWAYSGLELFNIDFNSATPLTNVGVIKSEQSSSEQSYPNIYESGRSIIHDEKVHFIHGQSIWSSDWSDPDNAIGPQ